MSRLENQWGGAYWGDRGTTVFSLIWDSLDMLSATRVCQQVSAGLLKMQCASYTTTTYTDVSKTNLYIKKIHNYIMYTYHVLNLKSQ